MDAIAISVIASGILSLLCLLILHFVSPEFKPNWRLISEYAMGKHKWLITAFFLLWGAGSVLLSVILWGTVTGTWGMIGVALLFISAIGEIMGGLFDVKHKLHGMAFGLGVPTLPIAALLISYNLQHIDGWNNCKSALLLSAHSTWISLVIMVIAMMAMFAGFKKAGVPLDKNAPAPEKVPEGVIALGGYANRLLVICYVGWLIFIAKCYLSL